MIVREWYSVYVGCWAPCLRIEPTAHRPLHFLVRHRTKSGFLCCIPKPKELLLPKSVKSSPNDPFGLRGGHESGDRRPLVERLLVQAVSPRSGWFSSLELLDAECSGRERGDMSHVTIVNKAFTRSSMHDCSTSVIPLLQLTLHGGVA